MKPNVYKYKLLVSSIRIFMFVLIIFRNKASIVFINEYHVGEVKIVLVWRRIFTFQNVLRNGINITILDQCNLASMRMHVSNSSANPQEI